MNTVRLEIAPLDLLFFRDGRPFGAATAASSGLPTPQVFAGALRTALLEKYRCEFAKLRNHDDFASAVATAFPEREWIGRVRFRGPWLAHRQGSKLEVLVAAPACLMRAKKVKDAPLSRLNPLRSAPPGWPTNAPVRFPLWSKDPQAAEPVSGYLGQKALATFLQGGIPSTDDLVSSGSLFDFESRTSVSISADRLTAEESLLYSVRFLALKPQTRFFIEVDLPQDAPADAFQNIGMIAPGGEGRRAQLQVLPSDFRPWPAVPQSQADGTLLLLTTPAPLPTGVPENLPGLVSAAVGSPLAISGWDMAKGGPRVIRFAAQPGSVYFLESSTNPPPASLAAPADSVLGWGCFLNGVWNHD